MRTSSAKAKGRRLQQSVRDSIFGTFPSLQPGDVRSTSMGASGEDILLSPRALELFPFSVECKNQEAIQIWAALAQAEENRVPGGSPLLVFKRNQSEIYSALKFADLLDLLKGRG